jgi:hypothetical protein
MLRSIVGSAILGVAVVVGGATSAFAQSHKFEISAFGGWIFSDGVSGQTIIAGNGKAYNRVDPKDSGSFGISFGAHVSHNTEIGFMYGNQFSNLVLGGPNTLDLGGMNVMTYHGYGAVNFGHEDSKLRPFVFGGIGASHFGSLTTNATGATRHLSGETQFSTRFGGGLKYFAAPNVGLRVAVTWVPAYIKSDAAGWWCDPFYGGCYIVGSPQYANQFEFSGGVTFRIGGR